LKALPTLIKSGLIESASMLDAKQEFRELTDPLAIWLERNCVLHSNSFIPKSKLLSEYNRDNQKHRRPTISNNAFTRAISRLHPQLIEIQPTIAGKRERCWSGIGLLQKY
jgi:phage/plasmid-associated DNA primase